RAKGLDTPPSGRAEGYNRCIGSFSHGSSWGDRRCSADVAVVAHRRYVYAPFRAGARTLRACTDCLLTPFGASGTVMARLVMKFGGTSVAGLDRIRNVARPVKREVDAGFDVAVVGSAMAGVPHQRGEWCRQAAMPPDAREYDAVRATGAEGTPGRLASG